MFLNVVLDDAVEEKAGGEKVRIGMVVSAENGYIFPPFRSSSLLGRLILMLYRLFGGTRW